MMTKIIMIILILCFISTYSFAQMGQGMMGGGHMDGQGMRGYEGIIKKLEKRFFKNGPDNEQTKIMQHRHMMNSVMGMTQDMALMMRQMSVTMGNLTDTKSDRSRERINNLSALMKDMSSQMNRLSDMMRNETASDEEIRVMQMKISELQERMWGMKNNW